MGCGVGEESTVRQARRELDDLDNVMFSAGGRWKDDFFTLILDAEGGAETAQKCGVWVWRRARILN